MTKKETEFKNMILSEYNTIFKTHNENVEELSV